jgi:hypothetical protein
MKKVLANFGNERISKGEMKEVKGGSTWCRAVCVYKGGSYEVSGLCPGSVGDCIGRRINGTSASMGLVCVNMECNFR